jgi:hypothetical protein
MLSKNRLTDFHPVGLFTEAHVIKVNSLHVRLELYVRVLKLCCVDLYFFSVQEGTVLFVAVALSYYLF